MGSFSVLFFYFLSDKKSFIAVEAVEANPQPRETGIPEQNK